MIDPLTCTNILPTAGGEYHEGSPYPASLPRRTISLGKDSQRPVVHVRNGYRGTSEEGEFHEE